jgi:hypothetical protein
VYNGVCLIYLWPGARADNVTTLAQSHGGIMIRLHRVDWLAAECWACVCSIVVLDGVAKSVRGHNHVCDPIITSAPDHRRCRRIASRRSTSPRKRATSDHMPGDHCTW